MTSSLIRKFLKNKQCKLMLRRCKADVVEFLGIIKYNEITKAKEGFK